MNRLFQMMLQQKFQQIPNQIVSHLESQLKRVNPQAFQEYQQAKKENNPEEYLNKVIDNFSPEQKQQWNNMLGGFTPQKNNINTE